MASFQHNFLQLVSIIRRTVFSRTPGLRLISARHRTTHYGEYFSLRITVYPRVIEAAQVQE
jgi:hypothetical protein